MPGVSYLPPTLGLINQPCEHQACYECFRKVVQGGRMAVCPLCKAEEEKAMPPSIAAIERTMDDTSIWNAMRADRIAQVESLKQRTEAVMSMVRNPPNVEDSHKNAVLPPGIHNALYYNRSSAHDVLSKEWNFDV